MNARIRKAYLKNKMQIISLNDVGDLTYPYISLDGNTENIKDIIEDNHEISNLITNAKKPIVIFGDNVFTRKDSLSILDNICRICINFQVIQRKKSK